MENYKIKNLVLIQSLQRNHHPITYYFPRGHTNQNGVSEFRLSLLKSGSHKTQNVNSAKTRIWDEGFCLKVMV